MTVKRFLFNPDFYRNKLFLKAAQVVEEYSFAMCEDFDLVSFDGNLKVVKSSAFESCPNLEVVDFNFVPKDDKITESSEGKSTKSSEDESTESRVICCEAVNPDSVADKTDNYTNENKENKSSFDLTIQVDAFKNCKKLHTVILPVNGNVLVEKNAFIGCDKLRNVVALGDVTIDNGAFTCCQESLTFICKENSKVDTFARENGFKTIYIKNTSELKKLNVSDGNQKK